MLEPLRLGQDDEDCYRALLDAPGATVAAVAEAAGCPVGRARTSLTRLVRTRLAKRRPGRPARYLPADPDVAVTALVNERQSELDKARLAIPELLSAYRRGTASAEPNGLVEVLAGPGVAQRRLLEIQASAADELLVLDPPPAAVHPGRKAPMLRRGVRCREIYPVTALADPERLASIRRMARLGERVRVARRLPLQVVICDRRLAMLPLAPECVAVLGPSVLLNALVDLFEDSWERSTPVWATHGSTAELSPGELAVLELLATGLKDEAIARQLDVSMRTARRRISALLATLGMTTRFQAGAEAVRRGLL
jgi:DNA-binding CsgD family transcriptional regulator